jgi:AraC-like DNA-binding protein
MGLDSHFRYLPVLPVQRQWGLYLTDCGNASIVPGASYPPDGHPSAYAFDWNRGRTLSEFQVLYVVRGGGVFEARRVRRQSVKEGDLFFLFPGVWHRYAPDPATGWEEYWIGFNGTQAARLMRPPFFSKKRPVLHVGDDPVLKQRFRQVLSDIEQDPAGLPFSSAGRVIEILGRIQERVQKLGVDGRAPNAMGAMGEAQNRILKQAMQSIYFAQLARELGMSYSTFRRGFKRQTGVSPVQFQNEIRINRARDLLLNTTLSVSEVAAQTGFETVYYFCRVFKQKTGVTPKAYRRQMGLGENG